LKNTAHAAFRLRAGSPAYSILYAFQGLGGIDGVNPQAGVTGANGLLYGTTFSGTTLKMPGCTEGCGTVYAVNPAGQETFLYSFAGAPGDGAGPQASVINVNGTLWGTTVYGGSSGANGGASGDGTVFAINASGGEAIVHSFTGAPNDGAGPYAELVYDGKGNLYGTTSGGGAHNDGTVFVIDTAGNEKVLYSFGAVSGDGAFPYGGLVFDKKGNLYGTTAEGGAHYGGSVFTITPAGKEKVIYSFSCGSDGCNPRDHLTYDGKSHFYGVTYSGGRNNYGTVFEMSPAGKERVLYRFLGGSDGENPYGGLVLVSVPAAYAEEVIRRAATLALEDEFAQSLLRAGVSLDDAYPIPASRRSEFEAFARERRDRHRENE
jgi:uncharacterized repeat protein (TIGR03803 family)